MLRLLLLAAALAGAAPLRMVVLGDRTGNARQEVFEQILGEVKLLRPDLLMSVGDLVEGYTSSRDSLIAEWDTIRSLLHNTRVPYRLTPGNHDISDAMSESIYVRRFGAPYYSFRQGPVHFTVLDNSRWDSAAVLPPAQLAWLERDLVAGSGARWTMVFMHRSYWTSRARVGKPDTLHKLFRRYGVDYVFSGHDHYYCSAVWDSIRYFQVGPSGSRYKVYHDEARGAFQNYVLVEAGDSAVVVRVLRPGHVLPPDIVTLKDIDELDTIEARALQIPKLALRGSAGARESLTVLVRNITGDALDSRCVWQVTNPGWRIEPETLVVGAGPGVSCVNTFAVEQRPGRSIYPLPKLTLPYPYGSNRRYEVTRTLPVQRLETCSRIGRPRIDGRLNDRVWRRVKPLTDLGTSAGEVSGADSLEVRFGFDDTTLYIAARLWESDPAASRAEVNERDGRVANDDNINFLLQPNRDSASYYQLIVNPLGTIWDRVCRLESGRSVRDNKWDGRWQVAAERDLDSWRVEIAVPLSELGIPAHTLPWRLGFNIARFQARNKAVAVFQPPFVHDPAQFAELRLEP